MKRYFLTAGILLAAIIGFSHSTSASAATFGSGSTDYNPETEAYIGLYGGGTFHSGMETTTCTGTQSGTACADYHFYEPSIYFGPGFFVHDTRGVPATSSTGHIDVDGGHPDFTSYGLSALLTGTTSDSAGISLFTNEFLTVNSASPGGVMALEYTINGSVDWGGTADQADTSFASLSFDVRKDVTQAVDGSGDPLTGEAGAAQGYAQDPILEYGDSLIHGNNAIKIDQGVSLPKGSFSFTIVTGLFSFTSGTPFNLFTDFNIYASMDNSCTGGVFGTPVTCSNGMLTNILLDASNTVELAAIIIPDDPAAQVTGLSGLDYTSYVTTEFSVVPVPPAVWLFGSGLIGLIGFARRRKTA